MKTKSDKQLCWDFKNACGNGCSWFQNFTPITGWVAKETKIVSNDNTKTIDSFNVIECPEFVCDVKKEKTYCKIRLSKRREKEYGDINIF